MYEYCYSNLSAIYAKGLSQTINKSLVEYHKDQYLDHFFSYSILMILTILPNNLISIYLLMTVIFCMLTRASSVLELETTVNSELQEVFSWLCANKLSQKLVNYSINL